MDTMKELSKRIRKDYQEIHLENSDGLATFINKNGVLFHVLHLVPVEVITCEYCPSISVANTYDFDPGDSFYDKTPIDELYREMKNEIDNISPGDKWTNM